MEAKENRYGIWLSEEEMSMIQNALEWMQNSCCNEIPKIADLKICEMTLKKSRKMVCKYQKRLRFLMRKKYLIYNARNVINVKEKTKEAHYKGAQKRYWSSCKRGGNIKELC